MAQFIVKGRVKYNGKFYGSGEIVEVAEQHVEEFKKHGWEIVGEEQPIKQPEEQLADGGQEEGKKPEVVELTEEQIKALYEQKPELVGLKNEELEALLEEKGVEFKKGAKKAILLALLA